MSVYELIGHPDYAYCLGDVVIRLSPAPRGVSELPAELSEASSVEGIYLTSLGAKAGEPEYINLFFVVGTKNSASPSLSIMFGTMKLSIAISFLTGVDLILCLMLLAKQMLKNMIWMSLRKRGSNLQSCSRERKRRQMVVPRILWTCLGLGLS